MPNINVKKGLRLDGLFNNTVVDKFGIKTGTSGNSIITKSWTNTRNGSDNPIWKDQVRAHVNATTTLTGTRTKVVRYQPCDIQLVWQAPDPQLPNPPGIKVGTDFFRGRGCIVATLPDQTGTNNIPIASARNLAIKRLLARLQSAKSFADAAEDLGEIRTTLNSLRRPLESARNLITNSLQRGIRDLTRYRKVDALKALADTYLEFQFGWKPLTDTIAKSYVSLQNREIFAVYTPISASADALESSSVTPHALTSGPLNIAGTAVQQDYGRVKFKGEWQVQTGRERTQINEALSLTPENFLPTVWNLIPYSFLVDYFTNVGDLIDAYNTPWGGVTWMNETQRRLSLYTETCGGSPITKSSHPTTDTITYVNQPGSLILETTSLSRTKLTSLPMPTLEFSGKLSDVQTTNVLALLGTKFSAYSTIARKVFRSNQPLVFAVK